MKNEINSSPTLIEEKIFPLRGVQIMIDRDLAVLYQVKVKRLNEQVKRNIERFPKSFRFQLTSKEKDELVANCDRFEKLKHSSINPHAFTEQGIAMLSTVLKSQIAIQVSISIMNAFVRIRKTLNIHEELFKVRHVLQSHIEDSNKNFDLIFKALENGDSTPTQGVFFKGQIFDAYKFISDLIRSAKKSIILIDNYVDDSVLAQLSKKNKEVKVLILTQQISKQFALDIKKVNTQYPQIKAQIYKHAHDRFLIIDETEIYHIGASLKDLGKKLFAFSKIESSVLTQFLNELKTTSKI